jgi:hypothetical protein
MAIRPVLKMGDPRLLRIADPVAAFDTPELHALISDMRDTMASLNGAGLAAPQIGIPLRVGDNRTFCASICVFQYQYCSIYPIYYSPSPKTYNSVILFF